MTIDKLFPILREYRYKGPVYPTKIPWSVADKAYSWYRDRYGNTQSLEVIADRGGFSPSEMDEQFPNWREESSEIFQLKKQLDECRKSEKELSDAYLRIRNLVGAWNTVHGGIDRFEVTENKIKMLLDNIIIKFINY